MGLYVWIRMRLTLAPKCRIANPNRGARGLGMRFIDGLAMECAREIKPNQFAFHRGLICTESILTLEAMLRKLEIKETTKEVHWIGWFPEALFSRILRKLRNIQPFEMLKILRQRVAKGRHLVTRMVEKTAARSK